MLSDLRPTPAKLRQAHVAAPRPDRAWPGLALRVGTAAVAAALLSACQVPFTAASPCDQMRDAQDRLAEVEGAAQASDRTPEDAPSRDELMQAYEDAADTAQACNETLPDRGY